MWKILQIIDMVEIKISERPEVKWGWRWLAGICLVSWTSAFLLRLFDLSTWGRPELQLESGRILSTHDSYLWLAASEGVRGVSLSLMPELTSFMVSLTGASPDSIAFWMPAVLSGGVGIATALWGWRIGGCWAALAAGVLGANIPGFFYRSRLGYYDTDLFILALPLLAAWMLAMVLWGQVREQWLPGASQKRNAQKWSLFAAAFIAGGLARISNWWHMDIVAVCKLLFWISLGLSMLLAKKDRRGHLLAALAVFALTAFFGGRELYDIVAFFAESLAYKNLADNGWVGILAGGGLATCFWALDKKLASGKAWFGIGVGSMVGVALLTDQLLPMYGLVEKVFVYLKPTVESVADVAGGTSPMEHGPLWPGITQSVIEAKAVEWGKVLQRVGPTPLLSVVGVLGYAFVVLMRPMALLLAPFMLLGLAGGVLGIRFTMFGGPAVAIGLGVPLYWAVRALPVKLLERRWVEPVLNGMVAVALLLPLAVHYSDLKITPVISKPHAEALVKLGEVAESDGRLWGWWDYGYATQFYGKVHTVTDGGNHMGEVIYPEALALTTDSFRQSTQVMKYSSLHDYNPYREWMNMPAREVKEVLEGMKLEEVVTVETPPQYVSVSWDLLNLMGWITYYGGWDLEKGVGEKHKSQRLRGFKFDPRGYVVFPNGKSIPVSSVDFLDGSSRKNRYFTHQGPHLIMNDVIKDAYLVDDVAYNSVLVQLLVGDPNTGLIARYFDVVVDDSPHVRIYKVK